jgi:hypothetical protein
MHDTDRDHRITSAEIDQAILGWISLSASMGEGSLLGMDPTTPTSKLLSAICEREIA